MSLLEDEKKAEALEALVHNEQIKVRATLLNTVAAGFIVAGIITPIVTTSRDADHWSAAPWILMPVWLILAAGLHYAAILNLARLR